MGSNSRYDRDRPVGWREAAEARALHMIGELVDDYPGITSREVARQIAAVLHATAIELGNGRPVLGELRSAVRRMADALRRQMQPPSTQQDARRAPPSPQGGGSAGT